MAARRRARRRRPSTTPACGGSPRAAAACTTAEAPTDAQPAGTGDPTELALLRLAAELGAAVDPAEREPAAGPLFHFDARLKRMSTVDDADGSLRSTPRAHRRRCCRCCTHLPAPAARRAAGRRPSRELQHTVDRYAAAGCGCWPSPGRRLRPGRRRPTEPRRTQSRADAARAGRAWSIRPAPGSPPPSPARTGPGIRIHVITGDYGPTAAEIARQVGIGDAGRRIVTGDELDALSDADLDALLAGDDEIVFARASPEAKLRICEALRAGGHIVAMTGDGVNDAPALRHADIGVAMGRSGTDVAREAATMVLTDDNFATIVAAVDAGRRVFDNVRKFVLYIFAHAVPEVVPFLVFALSGGAVPLPLTVLQILAIDLGTETLPALALGREPAEPGLMDRPPRPRTAGRHRPRAAGPRLGAARRGLRRAGRWAASSSPCGGPAGTPATRPAPAAALHHAYLQATTITFAGIVACQIGTAFAARTDRASLRAIGVFTNRLLLWGIAFELVFTAAVDLRAAAAGIFGTAALSPAQLALAPFPVIVWGADELYRWLGRASATGRRDTLPAPAGPSALPRAGGEGQAEGMVAAQPAATALAGQPTATLSREACRRLR